MRMMRHCLVDQAKAAALALALALLLPGCSGKELGEEAIPGGDVVVTADLPGPVEEENSPPRLHKVGNKAVAVGQELTIQLQADDDDQDTLAFSAYGDLPPDGKFYKPEARFVWTPATVGGPFFVTFVVSDMKDFDSETVELRAVATATQHAPVFIPVGDQLLKVGEPYELRLDATDEDGDLLYFKAVSGMPAAATFDGQAGRFRWTPGKADEGSQARVTFSVSDGALSNEMEVRMVVGGEALENHPPVIEPVGPLDAQVGVKVSFTLKATDPDQDPLTLAVEGKLPDQAQFDPETALFSWVPPAAFAGKSASVVFSASDGIYSAKQGVTIFVKEKSVGCSDDKFEPNNSPEQAVLINDGIYQGLSVCDTELSPIDEDWFKLLMAKNEQLQATLTSNHALGNLDLLLHEEGKESPTVWTPVDGDIEKVIFVAPAAGTYYLRVAGTESWKYEVPYKLEVVRGAASGCQPDANEPNETVATATTIGPALWDGTKITGLSICPSDSDHYSLALKQGDGVVASISFDPAKCDLDLYLKEASGSILDQSNGSGALETVAFDGIAAAGKHYLLVKGYPAETTSCPYTLELLVENVISCVPDKQEPNDSSGGATQVNGSKLLADLTLCGDDDWFRFPVGKGKLTVTLVTAPYTTPAAAFFYSSAMGVELPLKCSPGGCTGTQSLPESGSLFLKVKGTFGTVYSLEALFPGEPVQDSCLGKCDQKSGACWCDEECAQYGDCCFDICKQCDYCG